MHKAPEDSEAAGVSSSGVKKQEQSITAPRMAAKNHCNVTSGLMWER